MSSYSYEVSYCAAKTSYEVSIYVHTGIYLYLSIYVHTGIKYRVLVTTTRRVLGITLLVTAIRPRKTPPPLYSVSKLQVQSTGY